MRILIVDDDAQLLSAVSVLLQSHDHTVDTAASAAMGVEMVQKGHYDFILVDYRMPEHDGAWFLRNAKIPRKTKVLLTTAYANRQVINEMFKLGVSGYIVKPFDEEELLRNLAFHSRGSAPPPGAV